MTPARASWKFQARWFSTVGFFLSPLRYLIRYLTLETVLIISSRNTLDTGLFSWMEWSKAYRGSLVITVRQPSPQYVEPDEGLGFPHNNFIEKKAKVQHGIKFEGWMKITAVMSQLEMAFCCCLRATYGRTNKRQSMVAHVNHSCTCNKLSRYAVTPNS